MRTSLTIIIPVYNEAPALQDTLDRFEKTVSACSEIERFEILVVDDGSDDGAVGRIRTSKTVKILRHPINTGYGSSLKTGIRQASYPVIVICDADGSYAIEEFPRLLAEWNETTLVVADRTSIPYPQRRWMKLALRWLLGAWLSLLTYRVIKDINSGFRVFSKNRVLPFLPDLSDRFSFTTGQTLLSIYTRQRLVYVPTPYINRKGTSKVRFVKDGWGVFKQTVRLTTLYQPWRLAVLTLVVVVLLILIGLR